MIKHNFLWNIHLVLFTVSTMFENNPKTRIQNCERSELLHFELTKVNKKCQIWSILAIFWKSEAVLPDKSVLIGQKLVDYYKVQKVNEIFWVCFKQCESHATYLTYNTSKLCKGKWIEKKWSHFNFANWIYSMFCSFLSC